MKEIVINKETPEWGNCIDLSRGICKLSFSVNLTLLERTVADTFKDRVAHLVEEESPYFS